MGLLAFVRNLLPQHNGHQTFTSTHLPDISYHLRSITYYVYSNLTEINLYKDRRWGGTPNEIVRIREGKLVTLNPIPSLPYCFSTLLLTQPISLLYKRVLTLNA